MKKTLFTCLMTLIALSVCGQSSSFKYDGLHFKWIELEMKRDALSGFLQTNSDWILESGTLADNSLTLKPASSAPSLFKSIGTDKQGAFVEYSTVTIDFRNDSIFRIIVDSTEYPSNNRKMDDKLKHWLTSALDMLNRECGSSTNTTSKPIEILTPYNYSSGSDLLYNKASKTKKGHVQTVSLRKGYRLEKDEGRYSGEIIFTDKDLENMTLKKNEVKAAF